LSIPQIATPWTSSLRGIDQPISEKNGSGSRAQLLKMPICRAFVMKLIHRTITTLGIAALVAGLTSAVHAQPAPKETPTLIAQANTKGFYRGGGGGFYNGNFSHPVFGGFYRGNFFNPGYGGFYGGNLYHPGYGGFYHGSFFNPGYGGFYPDPYPRTFYNYNPGVGGFNQGSFFNPGYSGFYQGSFFNPGYGGSYPGSSYNPSYGCSGNRNSYDWGRGCFNQRDYKSAIETYNQAIRRNPKLADAYNKRALARFILGDKKGTMDDLKQAASLYLSQGDQNRYQETLETIREMQ